MTIGKIEQLIEKFENGQTSLDEEKLLRDFFRSSEVPEHLQSYEPLFRYFEQMQEVRHSGEPDPFAKIEFGDTVSKKPTGALHLETVNRVPVWSLRVAAGLILLLTGFVAGLLVQQNKSVSGQQVAALHQEIRQMKSALVNGTYQQVSASERISAVNLSARIPQSDSAPDSEISEILIYTMNYDNNTNVRQAAAEALFRFRDEPDIRRALVHSLPRQSDPLMQITLIDMLVRLKEKTAISEMQKLLMDANTQEVVKTRLEAGIAELKT